MTEQEKAPRPRPIELFDEDAPPPGTRIEWLHAGQEVGLIVRAVPSSVRSRIERSVTGGTKTRAFGDQSLPRTADQARAITAAVAKYALLHAEDDFDLVSNSKATCDAMTDAGVPMSPGVAITLKPTVAQWTDAVKGVVFEKLPSLAAFLSDAADKVAGIERDQEAALGKT